MGELIVLERSVARALTDEVKRDAESLWTKLLRLHEGGAHSALGYASWGTYFEAEFGQSAGRGYQLLRSAEIAGALSVPGYTRPDARLTEKHARELVPLAREPEQVREAWAEASANGQPTAGEVREIVQRRVLTAPISDELLERQQRETLIQGLDRAVYALEGPPSTARAEAKRLLAGGDTGPFTPDRFDRVAAYAKAFADALRKAGLDG